MTASVIKKIKEVQWQINKPLRHLNGLILLHKKPVKYAYIELKTPPFQ